MLTGGSSTRLGTDKAELRFGGRTTLEHVVHTVDVPVIVVGPDAQGLPVHQVREDPPGGGPAAGIAAALPLLTTPVVGVLATDMPFALDAMLRAVRSLPDDADGCVLIDADGREQYLCAAYRTAALRRVMVGSVHNRSMREILAPLTLMPLAVADHETLLDVDTPNDLSAAREWEKRHAGMD